MEVHICNLNTLDAEAGESGVQGHFEQLRKDPQQKEMWLSYKCREITEESETKIPKN